MFTPLIISDKNTHELKIPFLWSVYVPAKKLQKVEEKQG